MSSRTLSCLAVLIFELPGQSLCWMCRVRTRGRPGEFILGQVWWDSQYLVHIVSIVFVHCCAWLYWSSRCLAKVWPRPSIGCAGAGPGGWVGQLWWDPQYLVYSAWVVVVHCRAWLYWSSRCLAKVWAPRESSPSSTTMSFSMHLLLPPCAAPSAL